MGQNTNKTRKLFTAEGRFHEVGLAEKDFKPLEIFNVLEAVALEVLPSFSGSLGLSHPFLPEQAGIVHQQWTLLNRKIISFAVETELRFPVQKQVRIQTPPLTDCITSRKLLLTSQNLRVIIIKMRFIQFSHWVMLLP